jgi:hypothetical protein
VKVLVNVKPYHAVSFESVPLVNIKPGKIDSIPITLQNLGNYNDTFNFRIANASEGFILSNPVSLTLKPGETSDTLLAVAVPLNPLDTGTLHKIEIQAYSVSQPNVTIAERTVLVQTQGIYVSDFSGFVIAFFGIILLIIIGLYLYRRKRILEKICKKPEKPWLIPEEKKHLEKLKLKDKQKYNETFKMMEDEYNSSLLWYKYYKKELLKKEGVIKNTLKAILNPIYNFSANLKENREKIRKERIAEMKKAERERKRKERQMEKAEKLKNEKEKEEKIKVKEETNSKEIEPEPVFEEEEIIEPIIDRFAEVEKQRRQQILNKVRKAQDKQRRKLGKLGY